MCGIIGIYAKNSKNNRAFIQKLATELFLLSESRGKEASGFAVRYPDAIRFLKTPYSASVLIKSEVYANELNRTYSNKGDRTLLIGHSRLATNGYEHDNINNQPVVKNGLVAIHNGIIVNQQELWEKYNDELKLSFLDSELIPTLIGRYLRNGKNINEAVSDLYIEIKGMTSIAVMRDSHEDLILATNNGSIYYCTDKEQSVFVFASEKFILKSLIKKMPRSGLVIENIHHLESNHLLYISEDLLPVITSFNTPALSDKPIVSEEKIPIIEVIQPVSNIPVKRNTSMEYIHRQVPEVFINELKTRNELIDALKRCSHCILPETFPFIEYDEKGVCNYCNNHIPRTFHGKTALRELMDKYRNVRPGEPDCLIPLSGGRDSSYVIHYIKKEMGMNPIAYSYDWGMLTDLARRNQARMCGALGVEHILVSADIRKKRENIHKNVSAWLKKPHLGTIPLFMAGDKQYFYYNQLIMKQNNIHLSIMGENYLEKTGFKTYFSGVKQDEKGTMAYHVSSMNKIKMLMFYAGQYITNPAYINSSLWDTASAFSSYYGLKHNYVNIFDFIPWDEKTVESTILDIYDWETDPETKTTWRIGDGTAAFYNYIYYMVAGFTENDTFRSNQIREGMITREDALRKVQEENSPRWGGIQWYCSTIGVDWEKAIQVINTIKTLHP